MCGAHLHSTILQVAPSGTSVPAAAGADARKAQGGQLHLPHLQATAAGPEPVTAVVQRFTREVTARAQAADAAVRAALEDHATIMAAVHAALLQLHGGSASVRGADRARPGGVAGVGYAVSGGTCEGSRPDDPDATALASSPQVTDGPSACQLVRTLKSLDIFE